MTNDLDALHDIRPRDERPTEELTLGARTRLMTLIEDATDRKRLGTDHGHIPRIRHRSGRLHHRRSVAGRGNRRGNDRIRASRSRRTPGGSSTRANRSSRGRLPRPAALATSCTRNRSGFRTGPKTRVRSGSRRLTVRVRIRWTCGDTTLDQRFGPGGLSYTNFAGWPTEPTAMLAKLHWQPGGLGPSPDGEAFAVAGDTLRETDAPPAVRAAILRAIAKIPGVTLLGTVRDQVGRSGLGVAMSLRGADRQVLILDPTNSALLAEQFENPTTGDVHSWTVYLDSQFVAVVPPGGTPQ